MTRKRVRMLIISPLLGAAGMMLLVGVPGASADHDSPGHDNGATVFSHGDSTGCFVFGDTSDRVQLVQKPDGSWFASCNGERPGTGAAQQADGFNCGGPWGVTQDTKYRESASGEWTMQCRA